MFGYLQVIIPEKSIEGGVSNIVAGGPFVPQNASFLLERFCRFVPAGVR